MAAKTEIHVDVSYPIPGVFGSFAGRDQAIGELARKYGGRWIAQGSGMGERDIEFAFSDQQRTDQFAAAVNGAHLGEVRLY